MAGLRGGFNEPFHQWMPEPEILHRQRPVGAMEAIGTAFVILGLSAFLSHLPDVFLFMVGAVGSLGLFLSLADATPRGYAYFLAALTVLLVGIPLLNGPDAAFVHADRSMAITRIFRLMPHPPSSCARRAAPESSRGRATRRGSA